MIFIKKVIIDSFKLFENAELDFTYLQGICSLSAENKDISTFSSNSSGKTTFVQAISFGLFNKNIDGTSLTSSVSVYTGKKPKVEIHLDIDGEELIVINDNGSSYQVYVNGVEVIMSRKNDLILFVEKKLGISFFLFSHLVYLSPTSSSLFATNNNESQSKFISQLLSLDFIQGVYREVSSDVKQVKGEIMLKRRELTLIQNQVENLSSQLEVMPQNELPEPVREEKAILEEIELIQLEEKGIVKQLKKHKHEADDYRRIGIEIKTEKNLIHDQEKETERLIAQGNCPTCKQPTKHLHTSSFQDRLEVMSNRLKEAEDKYRIASTVVSETETRLENIQEDLRTTKRELENYYEYKQKEALIKAQGAVRKSLQDQLANSVSNLVNIQAEIQEIEDEIYVMEVIQASSSAKGFIKERTELFTQLYNQELIAIGKQLLGDQFNIEIKKNKSNGFELFIEDGEAEFGYSSLSSGFKARVDILLTLALNRSVELLTGVSINFLIFDEILSSVDVEGVASIEQLMQDIQYLFPHKTIIVVSHNQHLRFDKNIIVLRENNRSKILVH